MHTSLNILLIEDNPGDAFLLKFYLEESVLKHSNIIHSEYLTSALEHLSNNDFDIIILDLNLPDSNGIVTLTSVLKVKREAIIIVLTGLQDEEVGAESVKLGAHDFLVKGQFDGKVFNSSVRYAYESAKIRRDLRKLEFRFGIVQKLSESAYWRINLNNDEVLCSKFFNELVKTKKEITSLKNFLDLFAKPDSEKIKIILRSELTDEIKSINVKLKNGHAATLKFTKSKFEESGVELIAGIINLH